MFKFAFLCALVLGGYWCYKHPVKTRSMWDRVAHAASAGGEAASKDFNGQKAQKGKK